MRKMQCLLGPDQEADPKTILCESCHDGAGMAKAGWFKARKQPVSCDGNPDLLCVVCGYHYDPSAIEKDDTRKPHGDTLRSYQQEVSTLKPSELTILGGALLKMGEKILKACQQPGDPPEVTAAKVVAAIQASCRSRGLQFPDILYTSDGVTRQIEQYSSS